MKDNRLIKPTFPQTKIPRRNLGTLNLRIKQRLSYGKKRGKFTGKELDPETGLYYFGARYLDPKTSRWLSGDPALGDYLPSAPVNDEAKKRNGNLPGQGGVFNHVNLHVYHYAGNNPVRYTDPNGMWINNGDGTHTAVEGDTLWGLYGADWQEKSGCTGDPTKLQIGEVVGKKNSVSDQKPAESSPLVEGVTNRPRESESSNNAVNTNFFLSWLYKKEGEQLTTQESILQMFIGGTEMLIGLVGGPALTVATANPTPIYFGLYVVADGSFVLSDGLQGEKRIPGFFALKIFSSFINPYVKF